MIELVPTIFLAAMTIAAPTANPAAPIRLEVESTAGQSILRIVGESPVTCSASYELHAADAAGGNRSVNRGTAQLAAGERRTFATVRLGTHPASKISAKLVVHSCSGATYEQHWPAD